jgi:pimeloyl-ACP methyl ester carboxylesterase
MLTQETFNAGKLELNVAVGPESGPPLIMMHGVTRRWQSFTPLLPSLITRWQVFLIDARGHGRSERTDDGYHVVDYVKDYVAFLQQRCKEPAIVYGHSLGAMLAAAIAAAAPDQVCAAIMEDPPFETMGKRIRETSLHGYFSQLQPFARSTSRTSSIAKHLAEIRITDTTGTVHRLGDIRDSTAIRFAARCLKQLDPRVLDSIIEGEWLKGYDCGDIGERIDCPSLLLQADDAAGGMLVDTDAERLVEEAADCSLEKFPETGHVIHWERTGDLLTRVLGFLESI